MLEVNDFDAVRVSLASPEQIRSWSYGEVTKPETINYRTLKPEKDGLFCEKIFGPTKDFECYCGKYKRIRYKGVICDKCGVEVARSKVRRERMGHIALASPVAHIWFVKGTPSRLGLILDISPRSLERVLYFAQYIVTSIDEAARTSTLDALKESFGEETSQIRQRYEGRGAEIRQRYDDELAELRRAQIEIEGRDTAEHEERLRTFRDAVADLEGRLIEAAGQPAVEDISVEDRLIVARGVVVDERALDALREALTQREGELDEEHAGRRADRRALLDAQVEERHRAQETELLRLRQEHSREDAQAKSEHGSRVDEVEDLKVAQILSEARYRELRDRHSGLFRAGMGAEAVLEVVRNMDLDEMRERMRREIHSTSGQRRKKATKLLRVIEAFRKSGNRPEWMVLTVLPVLPPDLRPMVQLDGGRFATSDLNDLYRRVINRNNRLRRLLSLGAPEIIIRNEKRMLQEAVDSLIDNGRRGRAMAGSSNRRLKSLSDMLKGKQGRFRQNLLGKRVDYSGRSVIVVGPELKLNQCGLPKRMALELFKPFVMRRLVERGFAHNIKSAKRLVERVKPEVWDVLEEVVVDRPVLLNRAPTLHRLGIQAFDPVLIEGSSIQIHPLVCAAFNADFDGDQMAVHVPLGALAVEEAKRLLISVNNMLSPSSGEPIVAPTLDIVLGCYYMTILRPGAAGEGFCFGDFGEARFAYELGKVALQAPITVRDKERGVMRRTSVGRILFNDILPSQLGFRDEVMDKKAIKHLVAECLQTLGNDETAKVLDSIKTIGFHYATQSGLTIAISDLRPPENKEEVLAEADRRVAELDRQYRRGLITDDERYEEQISIWTKITEDLDNAIGKSMGRYGAIDMMATSGAKGNISQIRQMAGMRGLMTDPSGRIIELPIRSSFREGLSVLEYFISTHGARKGLADTALRTADSGYLTRRLVDVAQDVIVKELDCGTMAGIWAPTGGGTPVGRVAAADVVHPQTNELLVSRGQGIGEAENGALAAAGIEQVYVRSPLICETRHGVCQLCYGRSPATGRPVAIGDAVGIVAAQSIGEPGTQLTMRTFHTGGVAGLDITSGLPRVEELFEARVPKGEAIVAELDGLVELIRPEGTGTRRLKIVSSEVYRDEYPLPAGYTPLVAAEQRVEAGDPLAAPPASEAEEDRALALPLVARIGGHIAVDPGRVVVLYEEREEREYPIPATARLKVENGARVRAGEQLTEGSVNPQAILRIQGREAVQRYLVEEVQKVYRSQGVTINDKHIEVIVRQMLRKVMVATPGDTELLPGELVDRFAYEDVNAKVLAEGGEPATAQTVLLGVTKASLNTESFLAAASFQETTRVLTEAAVNGKTDHLNGLKENVIIGKLIPAGSGFRAV